jgi:hypothetical protein
MVTHAGDIVNLTGGCVSASPTFANGDTLQQVFGTEYTSSISCALPYAGNDTTGQVFDFSFDSAYAPTEVAMGLLDANGVVSLVDPPAPNSGTLATPEPSTWAMMFLGFGGLGLLGYRKAKRAHEATAA